MREIRIDSPGAGDWIMERAGGYFRDGVNHSFSTHRLDANGDGVILGGFALVGYTGAAMTMHMAGRDKSWFSRDLAATKVNQVMEAAAQAGHPLQCVSEPVE